MLARAAAAELAMREFAGLVCGRIEIKASQTIASHFLPAQLVAFHEVYPGIRLAVSVGNSAEVARAIVAGEVELGFVEGPEETSSDSRLAGELVAQDPLVMVVARASVAYDEKTRRRGARRRQRERASRARLRGRARCRHARAASGSLASARLLCHPVH